MRTEGSASPPTQELKFHITCHRAEKKHAGKGGLVWMKSVWASTLQTHANRQPQHFFGGIMLYGASAVHIFARRCDIEG